MTGETLDFVSRETTERLQIYVDLLAKWNLAINLVSPATIPHAWTRHIRDSAQLLPLLPPNPTSLVDLGSGAGFPGLVLAILGVPNVHLIESDARKATFLAEAARASGTEIHIHVTRIEAAPSIETGLVTARALKPLHTLLPLAFRFHRPDGACFFHKGASWKTELEEARLSWRFGVVAHPSSTDPDGVILEIREIERAV